MSDRDLENILQEHKAVKEALWKYHHALDTRQNGDIAAYHLIEAIESAFHTPWKRGATLEGKQEQP